MKIEVTIQELHIHLHDSDEAALIEKIKLLEIKLDNAKVDLQAAVDQNKP